jgi:threonine dehydratase
VTAIAPITLQEIRAARQRLGGVGTDSPMVRLNVDDAPAEIYLKLENLQPIGSFKLRGAGSILRLTDKKKLEDGVWTASAGNMAQGVAWFAREMGVKCTIVVPDHAPDTKLAAIRRLGGKIVKVPAAEWFGVVLEGRKLEGMEGFFIHPVTERAVIAGHGTIGLEILEQVPDLDVVLIPFGGGALSSGIASAVRALKPQVKIYAVEVDTAAPLAPSLAAGRPVEVEYKSTFVDGIGSPHLIQEIWPLLRSLLDGSVVVSVEEIADAIRLLVERNRVVAEGAGAAPVAAAVSGRAGPGRVVCIVSGGNLDTAKLAKILQGEIP